MNHLTSSNSPNNTPNNSSNSKAFRIAIICGGPSEERGISLNSARSLLDHLNGDGIEIVPFYVDINKNFYLLSIAQLYCNTPSDFDFKLSHNAVQLDLSRLVDELKSCTIAFPCIHGEYGEDGELQNLLEKHQIPFVGSPSSACKVMFNKYEASVKLAEFGFDTLPKLSLSRADNTIDEKISAFFQTQELEHAVVKPAAGGSSIGIEKVGNVQQAIDCTKKLLAEQMHSQILIEPFCRGTEFTIIVVESETGPVALVPTSIVIKNSDTNPIFDYRLKYLPTDDVTFHCPGIFADKLINAIQSQAEEIFKQFGMHDIVRIDGRVFDDEHLLFTDINPISGMEQNSFLFQQASRIGFSHQDFLLYVVANACRRYQIEAPCVLPTPQERSSVQVLFGGDTAERQVSLISGSNIWLKLCRSKKFIPEPYLLDQNGLIWHLPYNFCLNHTVEDIYRNCLDVEQDNQRLEQFVPNIRARLGLGSNQFQLPTAHKMTITEFCQISSAKQAFVFIGLHGGFGEDGRLQDILDQNQIYYNGSTSTASKICMDKLIAGETINALKNPNLASTAKINLDFFQVEKLNLGEFEKLWLDLVGQVKSPSLIIKPRKDGCSAGVVRLKDGAELKTYFSLIQDQIAVAPSGTFAAHSAAVEMSLDKNSGYLIEPYIETDNLAVIKGKLEHEQKTGWIELTVGVTEKQGSYHALSPSITVVTDHILSLEEKFQGGTGINITPPPHDIISLAQIQMIQAHIETAAQALAINNYARLDIFFNTQSNQVILIEANTLPGLTPSTVIYHQALAESPSMFPIEFLEHIIAMKIA